MDHQRAIELLPELASGRLRGAERAELRRHVGECGECREWLETWELLAAALSGGADEPGAGHPASDLLARLAVDPERLSASERQALTDHLAACPACRRATDLTRTALESGRGAAARRPARERLRWAAAATVILALAAALFGGLMRQPRGDENRRLSDTSLGGRQVIETAGSITATAVTIESGSEITFRAADGVILENGFSVDPQASFGIETTVR